MKKATTVLALSLCLLLLAGCMGTPVIYSDCTCPTGGTNPAPSLPPVVEGDLKIGLAVETDISGSKDGDKADFSVTVVAVSVDKNGVIHDCIIDGIATKVTLDATGAITSDVTAAVQTKNELGAAYGMVAWGGAVAEWNEQAQAFADYVVGKTVAQVKGIAVTEQGKPSGADLSSSVTISIGSFQSLVEKAVNNAKAVAASGTDTLKLGVTASLASSKAATAEKEGTAQLDMDVAVMTMNGQVITGCYIDSVQAKVSFDATGKITADLTKPVQSKNELGEAYGMVSWGGAIAEWNVQAESFANYVVGKTVAEVKGIAVTEQGKPGEADLSASVTIAIGGFQALIEKAAQ